MKYTLIGYPLGHSMSPWIHERLFALSNRKADYTLTEFPPEKLSEMIPELKKLKGFNITIPYKTDMLAYMNELHETAKRYSAVNCVAMTQDGRRYGYNTDCDGFLRSVADMPLNGKVLLIGCGGVGRMMATEAIIHGAELTISEPNQDRANALAEELRNHYQNANIRIAQASALDEAFDLIMNASPVGMYPKVNDCPVSDTIIEKCGAVFDVIYNPTETLLIKKAKTLGKKAVGGSAMLVWQAVRAHEIWDNDNYRVEDIQKLIADMEQEINKLFPVKE